MGQVTAVRIGRQLSIFGVEASEPSPADLSGLLAGPGQIVRMGGTARVSVVVDAAWRVHVLVAEFAARGLAASWVTTADSHLGVRTAYASTLAPLGSAWLRGAVKRPPPGFHLDGARLRLWAAAAGTPTPLGYLLRLGTADEDCWEAVGAALASIGLPAVLVGPRAGERRAVPPTEPEPTGPEPTGPAGAEPGERVEPAADPAAGSGPTAVPTGEPSRISGPAYRITGRRRLARLAELVGDCPPAAPAGVWPA